VTLLPDPARLAAFLAASVVLAVVPGPAVLYIVARTVAQGVRVGLASVAGVALGNLGNAWAASLGIAALVAVWPRALDAMRVAGAAWLLWLAWQALRAAPRDPADPVARGAASPRRAFVDGAAVALLNPKTALFFAAFLPQFVAPGDDATPALQAMTLSALFVAIAATTDVAWVLLAARLSPRLGPFAGGRAAARIGAAVFVALAIAALAGGMSD
jgi:threonine/homoserine/homoserine lactone efflux protein